MLYKATLNSVLHSTTTDGQCDRICHSAQAVVALRDDDTWSVKYYDAENQGETAISGTASMVTIRRSGHIERRMTFEVAKKSEAFYRTPAGIIDMAVETQRHACSYDAEGGCLELFYDLHIAGVLVGSNNLEVRWERKH